jgi:hypothetical protein
VVIFHIVVFWVGTSCSLGTYIFKEYAASPEDKRSMFSGTQNSSYKAMWGPILEDHNMKNLTCGHFKIAPSSPQVKKLPTPSPLCVCPIIVYIIMFLYRVIEYEYITG